MIETCIKRGIDMSFHWLKKNNPTLEVVCDKKILGYWYDFIAYCYALNLGEDLDSESLRDYDGIDVEISPLMKEAMDEAAGWHIKYNSDHQQTALAQYVCESCNGDGSIIDKEGNSKDCNECECEGYNNEAGYAALDDAYRSIRESIDTNNFAELSKITLEIIGSSEMKKYFTQTLFFNSNNKEKPIGPYNRAYNYIAVRVFEIIDEKFIYIYNARKKFLHNGFEFEDEQIEKYCNKVDEYYCESTSVLINSFDLHWSLPTEEETLKYLGDKGVDRILNITNLDFWSKNYIDYLRCRNYIISEIYVGAERYRTKYDYYVIYRIIESLKVKFDYKIWKKIPIPLFIDENTPMNNIKSCIKESNNYNRNILGNSSYVDYESQYKIFKHPGYSDFVSQKELLLCNCCGSEISKEDRICKWCNYSIHLNNISEEDIIVKFPDINTKETDSPNNKQTTTSSSGCLGMVLILIICSIISIF